MEELHLHSSKGEQQKLNTHYLLETKKIQCDAAIEAGLSIVGADDRTLLLDIDSEEALRQYVKVRAVLEDFVEIEYITKLPSKSGLPHMHIVVHLSEPIPIYARIAIQACLGSDPMRELLSTICVLRKIPNANVLFMKKEDK
jgi:hypothetical protein